MGTYQMKVQLMKNSRFTLNQEFSSFKSKTYNTFTSSYLNNCSDSYVSRMFSNLNDYYSKIEKTYNSILETWEKYIQDVDGIENFLANNSGVGSISTSSIRSILNSMGRYYSTSRLMDNLFKNTIDNDADLIKMVGTDEFQQNLANAEKAKEHLEKIKEENSKSWIQKRLEDVGGFFSDGFEAIGQIGDEFGKYFRGENDDWLDELGYGLGKTGEQVAATGAEIGTGIVEGVVSVGETIYDGTIIVGSAVATPFTMLMDASLGNDDYNTSITSYLWEKANKTVAEDRTGMLFDDGVHKSDFGEWMDTTTFGDPNKIRVGSKVVGSIAGNIGVTMVTGGIFKVASGTTKAIVVSSSTQAFMGFSNGYVDAIQEEGVDTLDALGVASLKGLKSFGSAFIGGKINNFVGELPVIGGQGGPFNKGIIDKIQVFNNDTVGGTIANTAVRITSDAVTGAIEDTLIDPAIDALYKNGYYDQNGNYIEFDKNDTWSDKFGKMFDANGGVEGMSDSFMTNGFISLATEVKGTYKSVKDINTTNKIKEAVANNETIDINNYKKIKNFSKDTLDKLDEVLDTADKKNLVNFNVNGKNMSYDELKTDIAIKNANFKNVNKMSKNKQTLVAAFESEDMVSKETLEMIEHPKNVVFRFKNGNTEYYKNALEMKQSMVLDGVDKTQINNSISSGNNVKINMLFNNVEEIPDQIFSEIEKPENLYLEVNGKEINAKEAYIEKINKLSKDNIYTVDVFDNYDDVTYEFLSTLDDSSSVMFKFGDKLVPGDEMLEYTATKEFAQKLPDANDMAAKGKVFDFGKYSNIKDVPDELLMELDKPIYSKFEINGKTYYGDELIVAKQKLENVYDPMSLLDNETKRIEVDVKRANYFNSQGRDYYFGRYDYVDAISNKQLKNIANPEMTYIEVDGKKITVQELLDSRKISTEKIKNYLSDTLGKTKVAALILPTSISSAIGKTIQDPLSTNPELLKKVSDEGLYHFTSKKHIEKIIESHYIKKSSVLTSYGYEKSFFFAGVPDAESMVMNGIKPDIEDIDMQKLGHARVRKPIYNV